MTDQITVSRALLRQAIDALSDTQKDGDSQWDIEKAAYDALRAALAEPAPAQEPIGWYWEYNGRPEGKVFFGKAPDQDVIERGLSAEFPCIVRYVYTSPQAQQPANKDWDAITAANQKYAPLVKAAINLICAVNENLKNTQSPQCFGVPFGELNALHDALGAQPLAAPQAQQPQLLTDEEIKDAIRHLYQDSKALQMSIDITLHEFRAIEQAARQKAGLP